MWLTSLSSSAATALFTTLKNNNKLKEFFINDNDITDGALNAIIIALKSNSCLAILSIYGNPLSNEAIIDIVQLMPES